MLTILSCPGCGVPAEVTDRFSLPGTDGPVSHIALRCAAGHCYRMPAGRLSPPQQELLAAQPPAVVTGW
ncbi:MAG TPA: hypothetical protein VE343_06535 [Streptosporangiaceae bacterium]|nr:hypothetical protein [Streptosporangiaceae bacterium]